MLGFSVAREAPLCCFVLLLFLRSFFVVFFGFWLTVGRESQRMASLGVDPGVIMIKRKSELFFSRSVSTVIVDLGCC